MTPEGLCTACSTVPCREHSTDWSLTPAQERDVLTFDPWGERDATYRVLREGFCVVRSAAQCAVCFGPIPKGERVWYRVETDDGRCATFRFCPECCWCIAHRYDESEEGEPYGFDRMYGRWDIGRKRAEAQR